MFSKIQIIGGVNNSVYDTLDYIQISSQEIWILAKHHTFTVTFCRTEDTGVLIVVCSSFLGFHVDDR